MADDPTKTGADRKVIDATQEHECRYWSEKFGISADELKQAIIMAGPMVDDVARYLGKSANVDTLTSRQTGKLGEARGAGRNITTFAKKTADEARRAVEHTTDDVMKFIGARPVASVLIGVAVGYALGWLAAGTVRHHLRARRTAKSMRSAPAVRERLVQLREWLRSTTSRAPLRSLA